MNVLELTPHERVRLTKLALAEILPERAVEDGVYVGADGDARYCRIFVPPELIWRSAMVVTPTAVVKCWPCWDQRSPLTEDPCGHSPIAASWPTPPAISPKPNEGVGRR